MARLCWNQGGEAQIVALDGDRIQLLSELAAAPGSRLDATLPGGTAVRVKVARCHRAEAGFVMQGRLIDMTRRTRDEILGLLARASG